MPSRYDGLTSGGRCLIGASFVFFALAVAIGFVAFTLSPPPIELARTGIPAKVGVEDYRSAIGSMSVGTRYSRRKLKRMAIDLTVSPWNQATYRVTVKQCLSGASLAALHVGATRDAFVDPVRRTRVLLVVPSSTRGWTAASVGGPLRA